MLYAVSMEDAVDSTCVQGVKNIRAGISCCNLFTEDRAVVQRAHSDQYHCLLWDHGTDLAETWLKHGPFNISLKDIDDIAMGLPSSTSRFDPEGLCFKEKQCCFKGRGRPTFYSGLSKDVG